MDTIAPAYAYLVLRRGAWEVAPIPISQPRSISLDEVLGLLDGPTEMADPGSAVAVANLRVDPLRERERVSPHWIVIGLVSGAHLCIGRHDGVRLLLDAEDVRLLDEAARCGDAGLVVDGPTAVDRSDRRSRAARLVAAGCLRTVSGPEAVPVSITSERVADDSILDPDSRTFRLKGRR